MGVLKIHTEGIQDVGKNYRQSAEDYDQEESKKYKRREREKLQLKDTLDDEDIDDEVKHLIRKSTKQWK